MPSPADPAHRLCIIGDSHLGSLRLAIDEGRVDLSAYDYEYWGATGADFRAMWLKNGKIIVRKPESREKFAAINGNGRTEIDPGEFQNYLFCGCRVDTSEFFGQHLQRQFADKAWYSTATLDLSARAFLAHSRAYRIAAYLAREHGANVTFIPTPLTTADIVDQTQPGWFLDLYPAAVQAQAADRAALWRLLVRAAAFDGIRLLNQPESTVTQGVFTESAYARAGSHETGDSDHKSPAFVAMTLNQTPTGATPQTGTNPAAPPPITIGFQTGAENPLLPGPDSPISSATSGV